MLFTKFSDVFFIIRHMKIYDLPQATKITINLVYNGENHTIDATVLTRYEDGILITPIVCDGEMIDYCDNANFEFSENFSGNKHLFNVDSIRKVDFAGSDFHVVTGKEIIVNDNQRKAERYVIRAMGNAIVNKYQACSVVIHDISMRGFSLVVGSASGLAVGDKIKVTFSSDPSDRTMFVRGVVVRKCYLGGCPAVGCEIEVITPRVLGFIMELKAAHKEKEREEELSLAQ